MALPATGVIEIRQSATANNVNGGGFNSARGGTDYTLQDASQLTNTDGASTASTTFTSALATFTSAMVGNYLHLVSATGTPTLGWYEIVTFTDANNVVLDRTSGTYTLGTFHVGGAMSLNSTLDDDLFEIGIEGNIFYIKYSASTFVLGEAVSITATGGVQKPIEVIGYNTTRGDNPTGANRPTVSCGANSLIFALNWQTSNIIFTGTGSPMVNFSSGNSKGVNCKYKNTSTAVDRGAVTNNGVDLFLVNCELISYRGKAIATTSNVLLAVGCYLHASNMGLSVRVSTYTLVDCIISDNVTSAVNFEVANTGRTNIINSTLYGSENTTGTAFAVFTGTTDITLLNNIIYGFTDGVNHPDVQSVGFDDYNCYFNNDTDVTNWTKGSNDVATNPTFTSVSQLTGVNASVSGSVITATGAFGSVTDNVDYFYLISGTGATAGMYGITSHTADTATLDIAPGGSGTNISWQITTGHNFAVGTNMKALGFPGSFSGALSTGYMDIGAVQRQEPTGGSGGLLINPGLAGGMNG